MMIERAAWRGNRPRARRPDRGAPLFLGPRTEPPATRSVAELQRSRLALVRHAPGPASNVAWHRAMAVASRPPIAEASPESRFQA